MYILNNVQKRTLEQMKPGNVTTSCLAYTMLSLFSKWKRISWIFPAPSPLYKIEMRLYWFLLLSTNNCESWLWHFISTYQSFRSKRSLFSGVSFTTKTFQKSQKVKTQRVKVAAFCYCSHFHSGTHEAIKKWTGSSSS